MKPTIREMIKRAVESEVAQVGGLGNGEAKEAARPTTPDSGHRRVDTTTEPRGEDGSRTGTYCRVIGYIPHFKGKAVAQLPAKEKARSALRGKAPCGP